MPVLQITRTLRGDFRCRYSYTDGIKFDHLQREKYHIVKLLLRISKKSSRNFLYGSVYSRPTARRQNAIYQINSLPLWTFNLSRSYRAVMWYRVRFGGQKIIFYFFFLLFPLLPTTSDKRDPAAIIVVVVVVVCAIREEFNSFWNTVSICACVNTHEQLRVTLGWNQTLCQKGKKE